MKKNIITLFLLLVAQWLSASGHFEYIIKDDGVYCGSYGESRKIEEADPETFEIVGRENSPWGIVAYYYGKKIGADPNTFRIVNDEYAIDKNHVFRNGKINHEKNAKTFSLKDYLN